MECLERQPHECAIKDMDEKHALPVWIGVLEAGAIAAEMENIRFSRPMTHDLVKEMLDRLNVAVKKIEVNDLRDNVYYARIHLVSNENDYSIDARPSDAIALALRMSSPIFVDMKVIDKSRDMKMKSVSMEKGSGSKELLNMLDELSPDEFGKYKM